MATGSRSRRKWITTKPALKDLLALHRGVLELHDEEGRPISALALWQALRAEAGDRDAAALAAIERAVAQAQAAAQPLDPTARPP